MSLIAGRRIARIQIAFEVLGAILKCSYLKPGERIESDLPDDARVVHVYVAHEDVARGNNVATLVIESSILDPVPAEAPIPLLRATFHRFTESRP